MRAVCQPEALSVQLQPEPAEDEADEGERQAQNQPVGKVDRVGPTVRLV